MHDWCSGCGCITKGRVLAGVWSSVQCCEAFPKQSVNHLSSATVEMLILDPKHGLPMGPPFQCIAVMLFNCKHNNNNYYFWRQNICKCPQLFIAICQVLVALLLPCCGGKNRTAGTYHGETWCRPCACGMTRSCVELLCHSKHPRWWERGFPHCYSQRLPLQKIPVRRWWGYKSKLYFLLPIC